MHKNQKSRKRVTHSKQCKSIQKPKLNNVRFLKQRNVIPRSQTCKARVAVQRKKRRRNVSKLICNSNIRKRTIGKMRTWCRDQIQTRINWGRVVMMIGKIAMTRMRRDRCKWMRQEMKANKMKRAKSGMKKWNH